MAKASSLVLVGVLMVSLSIVAYSFPSPSSGDGDSLSKGQVWTPKTDPNDVPDPNSGPSSLAKVVSHGIPTTSKITPSASGMLGLSEYCPGSTRKMEACVDMLGALSHRGVVDYIINFCCPTLHSLGQFQAHICLCKTIKAKSLSPNVYVPLGIQLLGKCLNKAPEVITCPDGL